MVRTLQFGANFFGKPQRHVLAPCRLAVDVVVIEVVGNVMQDRLAQFAWVRASRQTTAEPAAWSMPSPSAQARRRCRGCRSTAPPSGRPASAISGETPNAASAPRAEYRSAATDRPARARCAWSPVTKSACGYLRSPPSACQIVQTPSSAAVSEIIGPAGSDMQMIAADGRGLPDLEGGEKGAAALVDQGRGEPVRRTGERVELARPCRSPRS